MSESRPNPFQGFMDMTSEWNRMRQVGKTGYDPGQENWQRTRASAWVPTADIFARDKDLVIRIELAGIDREDVDISFHDNMLTVSGERESDVEETRFLVHERFHGAFRRSMTLPANTDWSQISADFDDGLLEITVQDAADVQPRRIEIGRR